MTGRGTGDKGAEKNRLDASGASKGLPTQAWVVICVLALAIGVACGHVLLGGTGTVSLSGRTSLSASELDSTIATYTYDGRVTNVTAREVLEETQGTTELAANEDGTYSVPGASDVLSYVQNTLIVEDAQSRGLTASDEEIAELATSNFGSSDYASIAESYGVDESAVTDMLADAVLMQKLQAEVTTVTMPEMPDVPAEPVEGEESVATAEYASYVIALLGDEWDSAANDWARTDGSYYANLSSYEISNEGATYDAAYAAYYTAYNLYSEAYAQLSEEWSAYTGSLLSNATLQLGSLA